MFDWALITRAATLCGDALACVLLSNSAAGREKLDWLEKAIQKRERDAFYRLGKFLSDLKVRDVEKQKRVFLTAANMGHALAAEVFFVFDTIVL